MNKRTLLNSWLINRIRSIASVVGTYGSICALLTTLLAVAILLVVSLIPLYLNKTTDEAEGELYCINNYSLTVGFQIPQYNTTFTDQITNQIYTFTTTSSTTFYPYLTSCTGPIGISVSETQSFSETCTFQLLSIIYPATPNAKVFENYALSEACYRTLQTCDYDPLLTACLLSNCIVVNLVNTSGSASYPLTYYQLQCTANIYYKTRCTDSPASYHLYYSSSQQNSACRQQRMNRINTCLNSTVQLLNVPCLISVSSGMVTYTTATCTQTLAITGNSLTVYYSIYSNGTTLSTPSSMATVTPSFTYEAFSASDQTNGHVYRISSVNSQNYLSNQSGALYCGAVTQAQISSSITAAISSQNST